MRLQQEQFHAQRKDVEEYKKSSAQRNQHVAGLQKTAAEFLEKHRKGVDVTQLNPAFSQTALQASDAVKNTMRAARNIGDGAKGGGDANYQAKLDSVASREISRGLGRANVEGLMSEVNNQRGILMDTSNFLNQDAMAGLNMGAGVFNMTSTMFQAATAKREMEMARSNAMMNNLFGFISGGVNGLVTATTGGVA